MAQSLLFHNTRGNGSGSVLIWADIYSGARPSVPIGGHFGFDEHKRKKRFDEEREDEERRKKVLREALFGLPPEQREEVTAQPEVAIERSAQTEVDYSRMLARIQSIQDRIDEIERQDEEDLREVTELIRAGFFGAAAEDRKEVPVKRALQIESDYPIEPQDEEDLKEVTELISAGLI